MSKTSHPRVPRTGDELLAQRERSWWRRVIRTACCARRPPGAASPAGPAPEASGRPGAQPTRLRRYARPASGRTDGAPAPQASQPRHPSGAPATRARRRCPTTGETDYHYRHERTEPPARAPGLRNAAKSFPRRTDNSTRNEFPENRQFSTPGIRFSPRTPRTDARSAPRRRDRAREQQIGLFGFLPGTARQLVHPPAAHLLLSTSGSHHRLASAFSTQISGRTCESGQPVAERGVIPVISGHFRTVFDRN